MHMPVHACLGPLLLPGLSTLDLKLLLFRPMLLEGGPGDHMVVPHQVVDVLLRQAAQLSVFGGVNHLVAPVCHAEDLVPREEVVVTALAHGEAPELLPSFLRLTFEGDL
jgi:hypothetical protein